MASYLTTLVVVLFYAYLDIWATYQSLGRYHAAWNFDYFDVQKALDVFNYSIWTSPVEFAVLCFTRILILGTTIFWAPIRFLSALTIGGSLLALCKLLIFDLSDGMMDFPGVRLSVYSTIFFNCTLHFLCRWIARKEEELGREKVESKEPTKSLIAEEEEAARLPVHKQLWTVWSLCKHRKLLYTSIMWNFVVLFMSSNLPKAYYQLSRGIQGLVVGDTPDKVISEICWYTFVMMGHHLGYTVCWLLMTITTLRNATDVAINMYTSLLKQDISFHDRTKAGEQTSQFKANCDAVAVDLPNELVKITFRILDVLYAIWFLHTQSWQIGHVVLFVFVLKTRYSWGYAVNAEKLAEEEKKLKTVVTGSLGETLPAIRTVHANGAVQPEIEKFAVKNKESIDMSFKVYLHEATYCVFLHLIWIGSCGIVYYLGVFLTGRGKIRVENFMEIVYYFHKLSYCSERLSKEVTKITKTFASTRTSIYLLNRPQDPKFTQGVLTPEMTGCIEFRDVNFSYPSRTTNTVLKDFNLTFEAGKTTALVGPSGSGKSTVTSLIERFYQPTTGDIWIDGIPINEIENQHYHKNVSIVAQEPTLFSGSIRQNIMYGIENGTEEEMIEAAKQANIHDFIMEQDLGYDTVCGERGIQLSGGQKQRVAIARAIARNPRILILDEATSALDTESEALVQDALSKCMKNRTVIVIAHRLSTVRNADKIAVIENGDVKEQGTHEQLMEDSEGSYYKLVNRQIPRTF